MSAIEVQAPTRKCAGTGRDLQEGERFCAVLIEREGKIVRIDYSAAAWPGLPQDAIAYWTGKVPAADRPQKPVIHDDMLMDCLNRLEHSTDPSQIRFRYVVGLFLMRRKRMKFEDAGREQDGSDFLLLRDTKTGDRIQLTDPRLSETEIGEVQDEVFKVFGWQ